MILNAENVVAYARQRGLLGAAENPRVELLAGGVACTVLRLHATRGPIVVKQAQERFRVREEWLVDVRRNTLEAAFQQQARQVLGPAHVPAVLDVDPDNHTYTMESAPLAAVNWKTQLLTGQVEPALGRQAAELAAKLHAMPAPECLRDAGELFRQQRLTPYFEHILPRYPEVGPVLSELRHRQEAVTHGDFTPKNFLVNDGRLILLDYEVGHIGWPAFDVASLVNHLTLKMIHLPASRPALKRLVDEFLTANDRAPHPGPLPHTTGERGTNSIPSPVSFTGEGQGEGVVSAPLSLPLLGALLLARVDGKSPAEYLHEDVKPAIRVAGQRLLAGEFAGYESFYLATFGR